jgi:hypothetical protein
MCTRCGLARNCKRCRKMPPSKFVHTVADRAFQHMARQGKRAAMAWRIANIPQLRGMQRLMAMQEKNMERYKENEMIEELDSSFRKTMEEFRKTHIENMELANSILFPPPPPSPPSPGVPTMGEVHATPPSPVRPLTGERTTPPPTPLAAVAPQHVFVASVPLQLAPPPTYSADDAEYDLHVLDPVPGVSFSFSSVSDHVADILGVPHSPKTDA